MSGGSCFLVGDAPAAHGLCAGHQISGDALSVAKQKDIVVNRRARRRRARHTEAGVARKSRKTGNGRFISDSTGRRPCRHRRDSL